MEGKRWSGEWNLSFYNVYARHNAWTVDFRYDYDERRTTPFKVWLFSVIPSVSYNIKF